MENKNASAMSACDKVAGLRMERQVVYRAGRQRLAERVPGLPLVDGTIGTQLGPDIQGILIVRVFAYHVD